MSNLRAVRTRRGLSQEGLERRAGVSQSLISKLELGNIPDSLAQAVRLARALDTSVESLFGDAIDARPKRPKRTRFHADPCEQPITPPFQPQLPERGT